MKNHRKLLLILGIVLSMAIATGGTIAYLTDTDSDVNVMALGNVKIEQLEYERVPDENGGYELVYSEENGKDGYQVRPFTQNKPLYPAVGDGTGTDETAIYWDQLGEGAEGAQYPLTGIKNEQDKFVLVKNTGGSDAYVRTIIAYEVGSLGADAIGDVIQISRTDDSIWTQKEIGVVSIENNDYFVVEYTYHGNGEERHPGGILPPGEYTYNSLAQVYMKPEATNEDCKAIDGNQNGTYDILVFSQAVQTAGFTTPEQALDAAFEPTTTDHVPWDTVKWPGFIYSTEDMYDASIASGEYVLGSDYTVSASPEGKAYNHYRQYALLGGKDLTVDLNGYTINNEVSHAGYTYLYTVTKDCVLTLDGNGTINSRNPGNPSPVGKEVSHGNTIAYAQSGGTIVVEDGQYNIQDGIAFWAGSNARVVINGGTFTSDNVGSYEMIYAYNTGVVDIYGGFFQQKGTGDILNIQNSGSGGRINLYGGTFVNYHPQEDIQANDKPYIKLAEGYTVVSETQANGDVWYRVVKE